MRLRAVVGAGDDLVLVLDLAPGGSLARLVAGRGPLPPGEVVTVAVPLAQALADVHARGLVHGDVTPANVLFAADGRPLLSDLGVSRLLGEGSTETAGTSGFVDPAVLAGGTRPAADVHGLAATCVAALTGSPPYDDGGARVRPPGRVAPAPRRAAAGARGRPRGPAGSRGARLRGVGGGARRASAAAAGGVRGPGTGGGAVAACPP